jgi:predicted HAD superfamily Cof-like phosphohydrolase
VRGTAVALGIHLDRAVTLVHESNMTKVWPDGRVHYRESDGKVLKPDTYQGPDMRSALPYDRGGL